MVEQCRHVTLISWISWESVNTGFGPDTCDEPPGLLRSVCHSQVSRPHLPRQEPATSPLRELSISWEEMGSGEEAGGHSWSRSRGSRNPGIAQPRSSPSRHPPAFHRRGAASVPGPRQYSFCSFLQWQEGQGFTLLQMKLNHRCLAFERSFLFLCKSLTISLLRTPPAPHPPPNAFLWMEDLTQAET